MPRIRVKDKKTGRINTIDWDDPDRDPTREEIEDILAGGPSTRSLSLDRSQMEGYGLPKVEPPSSDYSTSDMMQEYVKGAWSAPASWIYGGGKLIRGALGMEQIYDLPEVKAVREPPPTTAGMVGNITGNIGLGLATGRWIPGLTGGKLLPTMAAESAFGGGAGYVQSGGDLEQAGYGALIGAAAPPLFRGAVRGIQGLRGLGEAGGGVGYGEVPVTPPPSYGPKGLPGFTPPKEPNIPIAPRLFGLGGERAGETLGPPPFPDTLAQSPWSPPTMRPSRQLPQFAESTGGRFLGGENAPPIDVAAPVSRAMEVERLAGSGQTEAARKLAASTRPTKGAAGRFQRTTAEEALPLPVRPGAPAFGNLSPEEQAPFRDLFMRGETPPSQPMPGGLSDRQAMDWLRSQPTRPVHPATRTSAPSPTPRSEYVGQPEYFPQGLGPEPPSVVSPSATPREAALSELENAVRPRMPSDITPDIPRPYDVAADVAAAEGDLTTRQSMRQQQIYPPTSRMDLSDVEPPTITGPTRPSTPWNRLFGEEPTTPTSEMPMSTTAVDEVTERALRNLPTVEAPAAPRSAGSTPFGRLFRGPGKEKGAVTPGFGRYVAEKAGGGAIGGGIGYMHGDTPEEKRMNALFGAAAGFALAKPRRAPRGTVRVGGSIRENIPHAINVPRSIMASADVSAPLRQGATMIHRPEYWKAIPNMIRSLVSEDAFHALQNEIRTRPTYQAMREAKLALTDLPSTSGNIDLNEELFMSKLAEHIPGIGRVVRGSGRGYVGFLNKLRADTFDAMVREAPADVDKSALATYINSATGRGNLPKDMERSAKYLNAIFFSPRLMSSRLDMMTRMLRPSTYTKLDPFVRKQYLRSLLGFAGLQTAVAMVGIGAGADYEIDPRSSDFNKLKIGKTRLDMGAGFNQYVRALSQIVAGRKNATTGRIENLWEGEGGGSPMQVALNFGRAKLAPPAGLAVNMMTRKTFAGEKPQLLPKEWERKEVMKSELGRMLTPMLIQDLYEIADEDPSMMPLGIPAAFGAGLDVQQPRHRRRRQ